MLYFTDLVYPNDNYFSNHIIINLSPSIIFIVENNLSASQSSILSKKYRIKHYIRQKTRNPIRFLVKSSVNYLICLKSMSFI